MAIIKTKNLEKVYKLGKTSLLALKNVSLEFEKGDIACIMGPSGAGKSTLLHLLGCLDKPTNGKILINNTNIKEMDDNELSLFRNSYIGFIFQSFNLIPVLNVYENVEYPLIIGKKKRDKEKVMALIEAVGLEKHIKHRPDELSGGQRQRVAIARALVTEPEVVLADEPTANLDSKTGEMILNLLLKLNEEKNTTFIFSTHSEAIAKQSKKIIHLLDGEVKEIVYA